MSEFVYYSDAVVVEVWPAAADAHLLHLMT